MERPGAEAWPPEAECPGLGGRIAGTETGLIFPGRDSRSFHCWGGMCGYHYRGGGISCHHQDVTGSIIDTPGIAWGFIAGTGPGLLRPVWESLFLCSYSGVVLFFACLIH